MLKEGVAEKLWRGYYIASSSLLKGIPSEAFIDSFFEGTNYYIGLRYALLHWRLTDMLGRIIHVITRKRELSGRKLKLRDEEFQIIYVSSSKFFGYLRIPLGGSLINISDKEKTLIDSLLFLGRYTSFDDVCKAFLLGKNTINWEKVTNYAVKIGNRALIQRLGYLLEFFDISVQYDKLERRVGKNFVSLDPSKRNATENVSKKWKIYINTGCKL